MCLKDTGENIISIERTILEDSCSAMKLRDKMTTVEGELVDFGQ